MDAPEILEIKPKKMVMMKIETSLANNKTVELWQRFKPRVREVESRVGTDSYAIQVYNSGMAAFTPTTLFEMIAAVEVEDHNHVPDGLSTFTLEGGKYAKFMHHGPASTFAKTYQHIHQVWLPQSDYSIDQRNHFQVMSKDYQPQDPNAQEEVWVPILDKN